MRRAAPRNDSPRPAAAALVVAALAIVLALVGCGRKANPQPPSDAPTTYPGAYPRD